MFFMFICVYIYLLWSYNLFSALSSFNLVDFHLLFPSLSTWFCSLPSFLLFQVKCWSFISFSGGSLLTAFLVGDCCHRIHYTVFTNVMLRFNSIHYNYIISFYYHSDMYNYFDPPT